MLTEVSYRDLINHLSRFTSGIIRSKEFPRYVIVYQNVKRELDICFEPDPESGSINEMNLFTFATIAWDDNNDKVTMTVHNMLSMFDDRSCTLTEELDNPIIFPKGDIWMHRVLYSFMSV